jgi:hypothetical protein
MPSFSRALLPLLCAALAPAREAVTIRVDAAAGEGPFRPITAYPPKDYSKWGELVYQWVRHYRIDRDHSNAYTVRQRIGSP